MQLKISSKIKQNIEIFNIFEKFFILSHYNLSSILIMSQQNINKTAEQFATIKVMCRDIFVKKMKDYGTSWHIMRPESITDQIYIKANRIRTIQMTGTSKVNEGIEPEFIAIVNYGVIGLIQLEYGMGKSIPEDKAIELYDFYLNKTTDLMLAKNHDYGEAWRLMRVSSYTDIILQKILRTKQIEDNFGKTLISEGIDANYMDMINYSIFALIKLKYGE